MTDWCLSITPSLPCGGIKERKGASPLFLIIQSLSIRLDYPGNPVRDIVGIEPDADEHYKR